MVESNPELVEPVRTMAGAEPWLVRMGPSLIETCRASPIPGGEGHLRHHVAPPAPNLRALLPRHAMRRLLMVRSGAEEWARSMLRTRRGVRGSPRKAQHLESPLGRAILCEAAPYSMGACAVGSVALSAGVTDEWKTS